MILGFIGTGKISSSIIFGIFKSKLKIKRIYISSRNRNIAKKLSKSYGKVKVLNNNQEIIDKSSTILLGVTPNVGNKILPKLKFSKNKKIISLISTINLDKLKKITKNKNIARATPLPPIEIKKGPVIVCPPSKFAKNIFKHLGQVLEIKNEKLSFSFLTSKTCPKCLKIFLANLLGGQTITGPFLISTGGKGIALVIFLFFVSFLSLSKLIVEIRLIIFLFFENFNLGNILLPTVGVTPKNTT